MVKKLSTPAGRAAYAERKWLSEAPYGWIKHVLGFRCFSLRGLAKVRGRVGLGVPGGEREAPAPSEGGVTGAIPASEAENRARIAAFEAAYGLILGSRRRLAEITRSTTGGVRHDTLRRDAHRRDSANVLRRRLLGEATPAGELGPREDAHCIATVKHYRSLVPLAQDARKPLFSLTAGDGVLGSHGAAARDAFRDFRTLAESLLRLTQTASAA